MTVSRRNINPTACYRVTNSLKGTQKIEYFNSEIISVLKNISQIYQAAEMDHHDKVQGLKQRLKCQNFGKKKYVHLWHKYGLV